MLVSRDERGREAGWLQALSPPGPTVVAHGGLDVGGKAMAPPCPLSRFARSSCRCMHMPCMQAISSVRILDPVAPSTSSHRLPEGI